MNKAVNIVLGNSFSYPLCAFDMNVFKVKVPWDYQYEPLYLF